jgi:hypothetical protein
MKRSYLFAIAILSASSSVYANDVDFLPNGFVSSVIREAQSEASRVTASRTRAQVVAETREAARLGLLNHGEAGPPEATPEQTHQIEEAGIRAVAIQSAAK